MSAVDQGSNLSIIIPFYNEESSVDFVLNEVSALYPKAEIIAIDDGSTDASGQIIATHPHVTLITFPTNKGKGFAIYAGFLKATRDICIMLDGDGQNNPRDITVLMSAITAGADYVQGKRHGRKAAPARRIASHIGHVCRTALLGNDGVTDVGCALRAFRREHVQHLFPFEGLHRFMPTLIKKADLAIVEVPVHDRHRLSGFSKYSNTQRFFWSLYHIVLVKRFLKKPTHIISHIHA